MQDGVGKAPLLDADEQNEANKLLDPARCNVVAAGAGGGTLVLQGNEARALREHGDGLQLLQRAGP